MLDIFYHNDAICINDNFSEILVNYKHNYSNIIWIIFHIIQYVIRYNLIII